MGHDSLLLSQGIPELCSDTDGASGQLESQLWCLSQAKAGRELWGYGVVLSRFPSEQLQRAAGLQNFLGPFQQSRSHQDIPEGPLLKPDFWCSSVQLQTSVNHMEGTHSLLHNTLFSTSLRKISLKQWEALLLGAAVHSSLLAGLSSVIMQWGNPFCQLSEPGLCRRKHNLKRKDAYKMSHQLFFFLGRSSVLWVTD